MTSLPKKRLSSSSKRRFYQCLAISLSTLFTSLPAAAAEVGGSAIERADRAYWSMNYPKADSIYSAELQKSPASAELYWRLARLHVSLGETFESKNREERLRHYRKAAEFARTGIGIDSTVGKGHAWYAASLGTMADNIGTQEKLKRAREIKRELDTALRLNPNDETALSMLGSYYREAAGIGWFKRMVGNTFIGEVPKGDYDMAEKAFRKAISIDPRIIRNYHELALISIEKGNRTEAVRLMKIALDKPVIMASDRTRIVEMRALLKKMTKE